MIYRKRQKGIEGEALACQYLQRKGLKIIEKNWRSRWGEVDLIAQVGMKIVFVEVKARSSQSYGKGLEAVTPHKQQKMAKTALSYLQKHPQKYTDICFAVLSIDGPKSAEAIEFIEFPLDGMGRYY